MASFAMKYLFGAPSKILHLYEIDDSGLSAKPKGSTVKPEERLNYWLSSINHKYLSGQSLECLSRRFMSIMEHDLDKLQIGSDWIEILDFYSFLQKLVARTAIETVMGPSILRHYPALVEDYWKVDSNIANFSWQLPKWLIPGAFRIRSHFLENIKRWQQFARGHSDDSETRSNDYFDEVMGSEWMRAREGVYANMPIMDDDSRASVMLGLLFA